MAESNWYVAYRYPSRGAAKQGEHLAGRGATEGQRLNSANCHALPSTTANSRAQG